MTDESKKIEKIEKDAKQEVQPAELSEQDLDKVAGGSTYSTTRSNIKATKL
jgi:hypothetical protein